MLCKKVVICTAGSLQATAPSGADFARDDAVPISSWLLALLIPLLAVFTALGTGGFLAPALLEVNGSLDFALAGGFDNLLTPFLLLIPGTAE